jgi:hypothetical protein
MKPCLSEHGLRGREGIVMHEVDMKSDSGPDLLDVQDFLRQMQEFREDLRGRLAEFEKETKPSPDDLIEWEHLRFAYRMLCKELSRFRQSA